MFRGVPGGERRHAITVLRLHGRIAEEREMPDQVGQCAASLVTHGVELLHHARAHHLRKSHKLVFVRDDHKPGDSE